MEHSQAKCQAESSCLRWADVESELGSMYEMEISEASGIAERATTSIANVFGFVLVIALFLVLGISFESERGNGKEKGKEKGREGEYGDGGGDGGGDGDGLLGEAVVVHSLVLLPVC